MIYHPDPFTDLYSHTLEKRSSLVAKPPAGFARGAAAAGVTGAALLQPPKSSSALTLGGPWLFGLNPPPPPGTILWFASDVPPEPHPKSPLLVCIGAGLLSGGLVFAELHASFDPQASLLFHPLKTVGLAFGGGAGAGWDKLKTEERCIGGEAIVCFGAAAGGDGAEKSKRSAMPELVLLEIMGDIPGAESNAPKPLEELNVRDGWGGDC
jgi:hypothetical protein